MKPINVSLPLATLLLAACAADEPPADEPTAGQAGGKADEVGGPADPAGSEPQLCFQPGGDGWIPASVLIEESADEVVLTAYMDGLFNTGPREQLALAGAENGLDAAALEQLNAFRVRFDPAQCYVAPDRVGLLACTVYDDGNEPAHQFEVEFLAMDGAGVWSPATATVLGTATTWVSVFSTIEETTSPNLQSQSHRRYYAGNEFHFTFARAHDAGGIVNFANVFLSATCDGN